MSDKPRKLMTIAPMPVLFLVFLVLQLTHVIDWSWWWVTAPLWGPFAMFFAACFLFFGLWITIAVTLEILDSIL